MRFSSYPSVNVGSSPELSSDPPALESDTSPEEWNVRKMQGILKGQLGLFFCWPLCYGVAAILTVTYGGELLYLRIWHDHSARSAHIIVSVWFTTRWPICMHDLSPCGKGNSHLTKLLGGLIYEKSGGTITHLHTWQQDGCNNRFTL